MGLPARLSIYPVNHRVQILKSYFEKHLENGFYTAIYTYLYPQTRPLCLATDGFVALVLFSSPRRSQAVSKPLPDPRRTFIPHSTLASGVWVGGGEQSLWFLEGMASENPRGQILEAWWLLREAGPGSLGRSRTSGGRGWDRMQVPQCAFLNTRGHLNVHEAPAEGIPLPSREQAPRPDQLPQCCVFGLQEAASPPCLVAMATSVPRLLRAGGEKGGGKGT